METDYVSGGLQYVTRIDGRDEIAINVVEFDKIDNSVQAEISVTYQATSDCGGAVATIGGTNDEQEDDQADKRWMAIVKENLAKSNGNLTVRHDTDEGEKDHAWSEETLAIKTDRSDNDDVDDATTDKTTQSVIDTDLIVELPHNPVIDDETKIRVNPQQEGETPTRNAEVALSNFRKTESVGNKEEA